MRFLTPKECSQFALDAGVTDSELSAIAEHEPQIRAIRLDIERDRRAIFLARQLANLFGNFEEVLIWVTDYGIWPSSENPHLYYRLRQASGDSRQLKVAPGHLFEEGERDDFVNYAHLVLDFGWGANIFSKPARRLVHVSHDGWLRISCAPSDQSLVPEVEGWSVSFEVETPEQEKQSRH